MSFRNMKIFTVLAALLLSLGIARHATAADATLNWTLPTQRVDGTPMPASEIASTQVAYGVCAAGNTLPASPTVVNVPAPATTVVVPVAGYGTYCFAARVTDTFGLTSAYTAVVSKSYAPTSPPRPPVLQSSITIAYELNVTPGGIKLGRAVGSLAIGTPCKGGGFDTNRGRYYEVDRDSVALSKMPKSEQIVTECVESAS